jgi:hypothetical protein
MTLKHKQAEHLYTEPEPDFAITLKEHSWFILFTVIYISFSALSGFLLNQPELVSFSLYSKTFFELISVAVLFMFAIYLANITFFSNTKSLATRIASDFRIYILNTNIVVSITLVVLAFPLIASSLTILKTLLPFVVPYYLDTTLVEIDKVLHFGAAPWEILQPVLGHTYITYSVNVVYNFWFFMQMFVVIWQMFALNRPRLRMQFLISYVLVWLLLGSLAAILLSSAGPCYYSKLFDAPDPYAPLFIYLNSVNEILAENNLSLWALNTQSYLWEHFEASTTGLGSGISAMPSLHVAIAVLIAIVGFRASRALGIFLACHALLILIGSVHLGWHYAVDGYVSVLLTLAIWKISGLMVKTLPERRSFTS